MHESHERHERKTRQNSEAIAEVGDATQQGFLPTSLPILPTLSPYPEEGGQWKQWRLRKEVEILANHPGHFSLHEPYLHKKFPLSFWFSL